jgi:hypothetical protein
VSPSSFFLIGEVSPKREIQNFKIQKKSAFEAL